MNLAAQTTGVRWEPTVSDAGGGGSWYQLDESTVNAIASALDACAEADDQAHHGLPAAASARLGADDPTSGVQRALAGAFFRVLRIDANDPARVQVRLHGDTADVDSFLPSIQNASEDEVKLWRALADALTQPLPKSLLHDLLFVRRDGDVGLHAREAIRLYIESAGTNSVNISTRAYSALRALTLATLINESPPLTAISRILQGPLSTDRPQRLWLQRLPSPPRRSVRAFVATLATPLVAAVDINSQFGAVPWCEAGIGQALAPRPAMVASAEV